MTVAGRSKSAVRVMFVVVLMLSAIPQMSVAKAAAPIPVMLPAISISDIRTARLTPEGDPYVRVAHGSRVLVYNAGAGTDNREIFWDDTKPASSSATQCAVWTSGAGIAQNGLVFRIARQSGGYNAIVFAQNIYLYWFWRFAPKMFHTGSDYEYDWDSPPGIDLDDYLGQSEVSPEYPLRVCASLSTDNVLRFAVAKGSDPMPSLSDPGRQGGKWELDIYEYYHPGQGLSGKNGGTFAGHIPKGTSMIVDSSITLSGTAR